MQKKYSSLLPLILALALLAVPAQSWADDWILAAQKFTYQKKNSVSSMEDGVATLLPQLILEQISSGARRIPSASEISNRKKISLKKERTSLFLQLSKEVQSRDALVISNSDQKKLQKSIAQSEEKIKDLEEKLEQNLLDQKSIDEETDAKETEVAPENVVLYKKSYTTLFENTEAKYSLEKALSEEKINGLISGSITAYGGYLMVSVELRSYPGGEIVGAATDVGSVRDVQELAQNLVQTLMPQIANALPMEIYFYINPKEARAKCRITVDEVIYSNQPEKITVEAGMHTIVFESEGYSSQTVTWDFTDQQAFLVNVNFQEKVEGAYNINLTSNMEGKLYTNGQLVDSISMGQVGTQVMIDGKPVIGQFVVPGPEVQVEKVVTLEDGTETVEWETVPGENITSFFYVPVDLQKLDAQLLVKANPVDMNALINSRRIWAYRGYSSFVISLPIFMISVGKYNAAKDAYAYGKTSAENMNFWNVAKWTTAGITAVSGGFFLYELIMYLRTAAKVIPVNAEEIDLSKIPVWVVEEPVLPEESLEGMEETEKTDGTPSEGESVPETETPDKKADSAAGAAAGAGGGTKK